MTDTIDRAEDEVAAMARALLEVSDFDDDGYLRFAMLEDYGAAIGSDDTDLIDELIDRALAWLTNKGTLTDLGGDHYLTSDLEAWEAAEREEDERARQYRIDVMQALG